MYQHEVQPYLTMNGMVKYMMAASAVSREKIIRDYKDPEPEGLAQARYYWPALAAIRRYHEAGNDSAVVTRFLERFTKLMAGASPSKVIKLENNSRALRQYIGHFGKRKFSLSKAESIIFDIEGVSLSVKPHLKAIEGKRTRLIRVAFGKDALSDIEARYFTQMLRKYAAEKSVECGTGDYLVLDCSDGKAFNLTGSPQAFEAKLRATSREIKRLWKSEN